MKIDPSKASIVAHLRGGPFDGRNFLLGVSAFERLSIGPPGGAEHVYELACRPHLSTAIYIYCPPLPARGYFKMESTFAVDPPPRLNSDLVLRRSRPEP